jgi:hypothetical protein
MITDPSAPQTVRKAIGILWTSILFAITPQLLASPFNGPLLVTIPLVLALYALVVFRASRRHNWARYVLLIWTLLALGLYLRDLDATDRPPWEHVANAASFGLELMGVYFLFTPAARH